MRRLNEILTPHENFLESQLLAKRAVIDIDYYKAFNEWPEQSEADLLEYLKLISKETSQVNVC